MFNFVYRLVIGFSAVTVVFYLYATLVVPMIDTNVTRKKIETQHPSLASNQRYQKLITEIFPEDDWIRDRCKILDAKQSILFFKEAKQMEDGNWKVTPFTMFLNPDEALVDSGSDEGTRKNEKPIILRTDEGAFIKFEDGTSPNSPSGKFAGARMPGRVIVIREESKPGANDNFEFETRNIQVNTKQILAVNPVRFKYGKHYGKGHNLTINLAVSRKSTQKNQRMPLVRNLKSVELAHLEEIMLMPESDSPKSSTPTTSESEAKRKTGLSENLSESPIRVTCTGPFRLDFGKSRMILFDKVHMEQLHASKLHDHLYCDRLEVLFKLGAKLSQAGSTKRIDASSPDKNDEENKLTLRTVTAFGSPARLLIDSKNAYAQAHEVSYHIGRRIIHCKQDVILKDGDHQFVAPEMEYKLTTNNQLGTGWAVGPGQITGYPQDPQKVFKATWQSEFNIQPHEGKKAISLHGNAQIVFQNEKHFRCEELHFWIWEKRKKGVKPEWEFHPAQMLGLQDVTLNAPEFAGTVEEVRIFWPRPIGVLPPGDRPTQRNKKSNAGKFVGHRKGNEERDDSSNPMQRKPVENRIIGHGKVATAHLSRKNELKSFRLEGDVVTGNQPTGKESQVHIQSIDVGSAVNGQQPKVMLDVKGSDIQVDATQMKEAYKVSVRGFPSVIETEGIKFRAPTLTVDQSTNLAWSHVAGSVEISPSIQAATKPFGPKPTTTIYWNKKFEFNGDKGELRLTDDIRFEGLDYLDTGEQVTYQGKTKQLAARTNRQVNFRKSLKSSSIRGNSSESDKVVIKVQELALLDSAYIKATTRASINEIESIDEIQSQEINLRTDTGDARALGPGSIRSIRRGKGKQDGKKDLLSGLTNSSGDELSYIEIAFQGEVTGNVKSRRGKILENIRAVFGPVTDWNVRYDPDATSIFGEEVYLNCDQMDFSQWTPAHSKKPLIELAAVGNTELEGKKFRALASQLTYTAENEVVQLEGLNRTFARIWFRKSEKQPWQYGEAKNFRYQKSTSEIVGMKDLQEMRFLQFEAPNKRRK